jgi:hypothetical protein
MSALRSRFFVVSSLCFSLILAACGGSGNTHRAPQAPVFTSTPPTAAAQDTAYSYSITTTDPAGGTVSFALTTGPTGAAVSGNSLSWTPAAAQSRLANGFTVTATTSEGGTATQSWSVSPAGTVTVNEVITYWTPTGQQPVPRPVSGNINISAVVPQSDGSVTVFPGSSSTPGVIIIPNVPAGYYWLTFGAALNTLAPTAYWTSTSTFDAGRDAAGSPLSTQNPPTSTSLAFNLSGLDSLAVPSPVEFNPDTQFVLPALADPANSTSLSAALSIGSNIDWSKVNAGFLVQYEPSTLGPWTDLTLGPAAQISNLSLTNGTTNTITATLLPSPGTTLDINVLGSQWKPLFGNAAASAPTQYSSGMALRVQPYVTGTDATLTLADVVLAGTQADISGFGFGLQPFGGCDPGGFTLVGTNQQPAILTDQDLGMLQYGDPFPSTWTRVFNFCEEAVVPISLPNSSSTMNFALLATSRSAPPSAPLAPLVGPVQAPMIGSGSLFAPATVSTTTPTLSWSAPSGATPTGYRVQVFVATTLLSGTVVYRPAGFLTTAKTSVTFLPLSGGNTYVFSITAVIDGGANFETKPFRSALPTGTASVVSAPITISTVAAQARIHGNARVVKQLYQPMTDSTQR